MNTDLSFLDEYWDLFDRNDRSVKENVSANQHFLRLNTFLLSEIDSPGVCEHSVVTKYKGKKKWDICFPEKKILIEYKSITDSVGAKSGNNLKKTLPHRVCEALGAAVDIKSMNQNHKLGHVFVFFVRDRSNMVRCKRIINQTMRGFERMVEDGIYEYFCPLVSYGKNDHEEFSSVYSFDRFVDQIKTADTILETPLTHCMETR